LTEHKINNPIIRKIISRIYYSINPKDRGFLLDLLPNNSTGVELGVFKGEFTEQILRTVKPKMLYLIDLWEYNKDIHSANFDEKPDMIKNYEHVKKRYGILRNVTIKKGYSDQELQQLADGSLDWIYVDADHRYEGVKKDLEVAIKKVKKNGIIAGDDYIEKQGWGVVKAVNELLETRQVELILIKNYQFVLRLL
jgi:predicted O-methyltransferase YrrM